MERTINKNGKPNLHVYQRIVDSLMARANLASVMGQQYSGKRDLYKALGYPEENELVYSYYLAKYERNPIASAIIDRPANKTWTGDLVIVEKDKPTTTSELYEAWESLEVDYKIRPILKKIDKLANLGNYALLLFGFNDVKKSEDFKRPVSENSNKQLELIYVKAIAEGSVQITSWEDKPSNERYGYPKTYTIQTVSPGDTNQRGSIEVHHSRVLHINTESLNSEIYGRPVLKPVMNGLVDIEKLLGGDAEMFWRGARPGYTAIQDPNYDFGDAEIETLETELDKYEHDLRRFITAQGVDIKALETQVSDPLNHLDAQLQAISAQTGIPKRILIGSERGELSSAQDSNEWLTLIKVRQEEFAEPMILRPFVDKCMQVGILPTAEDYTILWEDVFTPSEKERVQIGKARAEVLKIYSDSMDARTIMPIEVFLKHLMSFSDEEALQIVEEIGDIESIMNQEEDRVLEEGEEVVVEEEEEIEEESN